MVLAYGTSTYGPHNGIMREKRVRSFIGCGKWSLTMTPVLVGCMHEINSNALDSVSSDLYSEYSSAPQR